MLPYYPQPGSTGAHHDYTINSWYRHLVSEYTGLNFFEVSQLDYVQYLVWRRDAFIHMLSRTEAGQEYLDNAWRMEQTTPDRKKLRKKYGEGGT